MKLIIFSSFKLHLHKADLLKHITPPVLNNNDEQCYINFPEL